MALEVIRLRPGVTVELTRTLNTGGYSDSQLIRFFAGQLQKYGGWSRLAGVAALRGQCRGLHGWADILGYAYLAAGTEQQLAVISGGTMTDITPIVATTNIAPAMATTAGSAIIVVTDASYASAGQGDPISVVTAVSIGGLIIQGTYAVSAVITPAQYTITAATPAPLTQPSGGAVAVYQTVSGSAVVTVVLAAHGLVVGANYNEPITTSIAGLTLFGNYTVQAVLDASTFQIAGASLANATTSVTENSGQMRINYLLPAGQPLNVSLGGWGVGDWGAGDWGASNTTVGPTVPTRTWSMDHFGQDLVASPDLGKIYYWVPPGPNPAVVMPNAPTINKVVHVLTQVQMVASFGSEVGGTYFPTLIRWCDSGNFTDWVASPTNQAGSYQIPSGSYITSAISVGLGALVWTDVGMLAMTYQGLPFVFGFNPIGVNCEAISKRAPAVIGSSVLWPSERGFFRYDGNGISPVECPVYDFMFNNMDDSQRDQVFSGVNTLFNEVTWWFPVSAAAAAAAAEEAGEDPNEGPTEPIGEIWYVKFNYVENTWDKGDFTRTAWCDHSPFGNPLGTDEQGIIYQHEIGTDADGLALTCWAETGYYEIGSGDALAFVNAMIPDFLASDGSSIQITILATDYPGAPVRSYGPFTVSPTSRRINCSLRARQVAFRIGSSDTGSSWRMGAVRYATKPSGTRP